MIAAISDIQATLLVCAAETANNYSLAQLAGTNGKSGFFNSLANGVLGNTFSTITDN